MTDAPTWTILVPTLGQRAPLFQRLMDQLLPQVDRHAGRVRVVSWWNNGDPPLADIRQALVLDTTTDYLSFVDDDDLVPDYFVDETLAALASRPDYVGWQTHYTANGVDHGLVDQSLRHGGWREIKKPVYQLLRDITHINPIRADVAKRADFRKGSRSGRPEDRPWVEQIRQTRALKTEVYIDKVMYEYLWRRDTSAWQHPERINREPTRRPAVTSPYFSWHPRSAGIATTPEGATVPELLIIIPTRGRPQNMARVIEAWHATGAFEVASVLFAVDEDDPARDDYLKVPAPPGAILTVREREPMARRTNTEAALYVDQFYALGSAGDDHVPETAGWAQRYLTELKALGAGVVYGDDGFQHHNLSTEWAMTSNVVKALDGRLVPAPVDHLYADNSVHDLARVAGILKYLPDIKITHHHPAAGLAQRDEGYQRVNAREKYAEDGDRFKKWRRLQLPADVSAVRALNPLVTAAPGPPPGRTNTRHRTRLGAGPGGAVRSRPSTRLDPDRQRRNRTMKLPTRIRQVRGLTSEEALFALADMARQVPADQEIVELGVYQGQSVLVLAWGAGMGNQAHVTGIDPWELVDEAFEKPTDPKYRNWPAFNDTGARRWAEWNVKSLGYSRNVRLVHGFSAEIGHLWDGPPVGLLFVDGDHRYAAVHADVTAWASHLTPDATIVFDDYESSHPDTIRAIDDLVTAGVVEPIQLHSGRLAVTRLTEEWNGALHKLMGGWVPATEDQPPAEQPGEDPEGDRRPGDGENDPAWSSAEDMGDAGALDLLQQDEQATEFARLVVAEGPEADATTMPAGTSIEDLNTVQLRALAKTRGIKLGTRKDKKDEMLAALRVGE